jgi:hypothetical protein
LMTSRPKKPCRNKTPSNIRIFARLMQDKDSTHYQYHLFFMWGGGG